MTKYTPPLISLYNVSSSQEQTTTMEEEALLSALLIITLLVAIPILIIILSRRSHRRLVTKWRKRGTCSLPRGSLGWPLVGETLDFVLCAFSPRPQSFMDRRRLMYGKVFKSHLFGSPTIVSTDAAFSRLVLQGDAGAFVPWYPKSLTELMGKSSILLINGGLQRRVHGLVGAFFRSPQLKAQITADLETYVQQSMASWEDGQLVHIQDQTKHIVFQILVKGLIGLEPGEELDSLKQQFKEFVAGLMSIPVKLPGTRLYRSLQARKKMLILVEKIIGEKRRRRKEELDKCYKLGIMGMGTKKKKDDVVDVLINDTSNQLTDDLISDNVIDLMIPGEDSVPILLTLAIKYLTDSPVALQHLEEENMQMKKRRSQLGGNLHWTDYMSLSFTQDVITETLRLGNIISGIMRTAVRDVELMGHFVPKGWCVFTYFRSVHLDDLHFQDPNNFNPWRWKDKDTSSCSFTPFGGGQRLCPGLDLARLEAAIFLHHLVTDFTWVAEKEDYVVNFPTVRMKEGMPIRVTRKKERKKEAFFTHSPTPL